MRRNILAIIIFCLFPTVLSGNNNLYYDMKINSNLFTNITITTLDSSSEKLFQKSKFIRVYSKSLDRKFDVPILKNKGSTASGIIPYSNDWVILGGVLKNKLIKRLSSDEATSQQLSNISFVTTYLNDENLSKNKPIIKTCSNNALYLSFPNLTNMKNIFVILTNGNKERYVSQYFGKYSKKLMIKCPTSSVFVRYVLF